MDHNVTLDVPKSIFGRNRSGREIRKKRQIMEMLLQREGDAYNHYNFKLQPGMEPQVPAVRPFPQCCKDCMKDAEAMIPGSFRQLGLVDCFKPSTSSPYNSFSTRIFSFLNHYHRQTGVLAKFYNIPSWKELSGDNDLMTLYSENDRSDERRQAVLNVLDKLQVTKIWETALFPFLWLSAWLCQKYLACFFESVLVNEGQIKMLKEVHAMKLPIIYIPRYQSHWDTTLILFALAHNGLPTPFFIPSYGSGTRFGRYFGGIGGAIQTPSQSLEDDYKYSAALSCYLRHIIRKKNSLMFRLEYEASQTGRPSALVYGSELLKVLYDEYSSRKTEDMYFVPVSINYESLPEMDSNGISFTTTNPVKLLYSWFSYLPIKVKRLFALKGQVKIDFSQPICMRELERSLKRNPKVHLVAEGENGGYHQSRDCSYLAWSSKHLQKTVSPLYGALGPLYPIEQYTEAAILDVMNHHLIYDAGKCGSVMPVHLVAFLLMKKYLCSSVYLKQLLQDLEWLKSVVKGTKRDFAFSVNNTDTLSIAYRGLQFLYPDVTCSWIENQEDYKISMNNNLNWHKIEYYSNYLLPDFMLEGIIATAVFSMVGNQLTFLRGYNLELIMKDEDFMHHCRRIYEVFSSTFILNSPCLSADTAIRKQVMEMSDTGRLCLVKKESRPQYWEDEIEDEIIDGIRPHRGLDHGFIFIPEEVKVTTSEAVFEYMNFHRNLITPYLELYAFLTTSLKVLLNRPGEYKKEMEFDALENYLLEVLKKEADGGKFQTYRPLINLDLVKCFLAKCDDHKIIYRDNPPDTTTRLYGLMQEYDTDGGRLLDDQADAILFYTTR